MLCSTNNDVLMLMDDQMISLLVLLDVSGAFITIDLQCLLEILKTPIGISGHVFKWIEPYFSDRKQTIEMEETVPFTWLCGHGTVILI